MAVMYLFSYGIQLTSLKTLTSLLLINIGNTSTQFVFPNGKSEIISSAAFVKGALPSSPTPWPEFWLAASVLPAAKPVLEALAGSQKKQLRWLSYKDLTGIDCRQVDMTTVGSDRLANVAAAVATLDLPAIVVDCGTAITTEVVVPGPVFLGGAIMPGRMMQRQALSRFTGLLPDVPLASTPPPSVIGRTTPNAIMAGVDAGTLCGVERLIQCAIDEMGNNDVTVAGTGGDAGFFIKHSSLIQPAPAGFTILGLRAIAETIQWPNQ